MGTIRKWPRTALLAAAIVAAPMLAAPSSAAPQAGPFDCGSISSDRPVGKVAAITNAGATGTIDLESLSVDERSFLLLNARQEGITLEEAAERYGWHEPFSLMVDQVRKRYPDDFSGAAIDPTETVRGWIAFRDAAPEAAVATVETFPYPVAVVEHRGFSELEIDQRVVDAHYAVWGQQQLVSQVSSGFDGETGRITIEVEPVEGGAVADLHAQIVQVLPSAVRRMPVAICVVDEVPSRKHSSHLVRGGDRLNHAAGHYCTAGFTVQGATRRGVATAGHCGQSHLLPLRHGNDSLTHNRSHQGQWGDIGWHNSWTKTHVNKVRSQGFTVTIRGVGTAERGQRLCKHGQRTGYSCDDVSRWLNECIGSACRLVLMERNYSGQGDSGGPFWSGSTAYGIVAGAKTKEWCGGSRCWRDAFTQVRYISNALGGVTIATS